ncbi:hypothetical protein HaLaN_16322 [Haematococcus lacustris]|uniref:Uncharacterized protein n=1 Tax=Haematococcus lacustris TaxID=44745 RepID=A0A699ZTR9_HAELA|nr:hypothetical protein HaLaN_16322 [Haematococcus lacustris]
MQWRSLRVQGLDGVKAALGPLNRTPDAAASIVTTGPKTSQRPSHSGATSYGLDQPLPASHTSKQATQPAHERQDSSALPAPPLPTLQRGGTGSSLAQPSYGLLSEITPAAAPSPAAGFGFGPGGNPDLDPGLRGLSSSGQQTAAPFPVAPSQPPTLNQTGPYGLQAEQPTGAGRAPSFSGVAGMAPGAAASSQQLPGPGPATTQLFGPQHPGAQLDGALMQPQPAAQLLQGQYQHPQAGLQDQQQLGQQYQQQPGQPGQQYQQQPGQQYQQQLGQQYQQQAGSQSSRPGPCSKPCCPTPSIHARPAACQPAGGGAHCHPGQRRPSADGSTGAATLDTCSCTVQTPAAAAVTFTAPSIQSLFAD